MTAETEAPAEKMATEETNENEPLKKPEEKKETEDQKKPEKKVSEKAIVCTIGDKIVWDPVTSDGKFPTKEQSITFLQERGILHKKRKCEDGHAMVIALDYNPNPKEKNHKGELRKMDVWKCPEFGCKRYKAIKKDTWLEKELLSYSNVLGFIYYWCKEKATVKFCEKELDMEVPKTIRWHNLLTEIAGDDLLENPRKIGGIGLMVEVDVGHYGRPKLHTGGKPREVYVFGGICRQTRQCFLVEIADKKGYAELENAIQKYVKPGTTIVVKKEDRVRYKHLITNKSYKFSNNCDVNNNKSLWIPAKDEYKPHKFGYKLKKKSKTNTKPKQIDVQQYFVQFLWRTKVKGDRLEPFNAMMALISQNFGPEVKLNPLTKFKK